MAAMVMLTSNRGDFWPSGDSPSGTDLHACTFHRAGRNRMAATVCQKLLPEHLYYKVVPATTTTNSTSCQFWDHSFQKLLPAYICNDKSICTTKYLATSTYLHFRRQLHRLASPPISDDCYTLGQPLPSFSRTVAHFGNFHLDFRRQLRTLMTEFDTSPHLWALDRHHLRKGFAEEHNDWHSTTILHIRRARFPQRAVFREHRPA